MFRINAEKQGMMCCRMLVSRANSVTEASFPSALCLLMARQK